MTPADPESCAICGACSPSRAHTDNLGTCSEDNCRATASDVADFPDGPNLQTLWDAVDASPLLQRNVSRRERDLDVMRCTVEWRQSRGIRSIDVTREVCEWLARELHGAGLEVAIGTEDPVGIELVFAEELPADVLESCERVEESRGAA